MLNYVNEFYCASSNNGESIALKLIQADVNVSNADEDGEKIEVASIVMDKTTALNLVLQLAEIIPEIKASSDEDSE